MDAGDAGTVGVGTVVGARATPSLDSSKFDVAQNSTELCTEGEREAQKGQVPKLGSQDGSVGRCGSFSPQVPHHGHAAPLSLSMCDSPRPALVPLFLLYLDTLSGEKSKMPFKA